MKIWRRAAAASLSLAIVLAGMQNNPQDGVRVRAALAEEEELPTEVVTPEGGHQSICLGTSGMAAPKAGGENWSGDYVYFGSLDAEPLRWRVLDATGTAGNSSVEGGILLQSDKVLKSAPFSDGNGQTADNQWKTSSIRTWLQGKGSSQLMAASNFTAGERDAVMETTRAAAQSVSGTLRSTGLEKDTMFLLDVSDIANPAYGYQYDNGFLKNGGYQQGWWLRSSYVNEKFGEMADKLVGSVLPGGYVFFNVVSDDTGGVVPACNLEGEKVLLLSPAGWKKSDELKKTEMTGLREWKLTLSEGQTLSVTKEAERSQQVITVPYTYTGTLADRISVMLTDGEVMQEGTTVTHYGRVSDGKPEKEGVISFTLPEDFDETAGCVYLLAEQANDGKQSDYASEPVKLTLPPKHEHQWEWSFDEDAHWHVCTAPECDLPADARTDYEEHDFGENEGIVIREATEEEDGAELILCDICGNMIEQPLFYEGPEEDEPGEEEPGEEEPGEDEPEEHEFAEQIIKAPTCTQTGLKRVFCTDEDCQESMDVEIPALSQTLTHTFGEWKQVTAPTVEKEGRSVRTCTVCGVQESGNVPKLPPVHVHDYREGVWLTNETSHWNQCACGAKKNAGRHKWKQGRLLRAVTKKLGGELSYTCTVCGSAKKLTTEKAGTVFVSGKYRYRVLKGKSKDKEPSLKLLGFAKGKTAKAVNVPDTVTYKGVTYAVTMLGDKAFASDRQIRTVKTGARLQHIGNFAFFGAENIQNLTIGGGVKTIGEHAFCHMKQAKRIWVYSQKLQETEGPVCHDTGNAVIMFGHGISIKKAGYYADKVFHYPRSRTTTCK